MVPGSALRPARPQTPGRRGADPVPGNLARSESASGTWWRGIRRLTALLGWERGRLEPDASLVDAGPDKLGPPGVRRMRQRHACHPVKEALVVRCVRVPHLEVNR